MSKSAAFFVLLIALLSGVFASATVVNYVRASQSQLDLSAFNHRSVLLAKHEITVGSIIGPADFIEVQREPDRLPGSVITSATDIIGCVAKTTIYPGEYLLSHRITKPGGAVGLASLIPSGYRAITLRVDDSSGLSGFVQPGNMVDVLSTFTLTDETRDTVTKVILQNARVIAKGQQTSIHEEKAGRTIPTVTLLVTLAQAEKLTLVENRGTIRLVLRNQGDAAEEETNGANLSDFDKETLPAPVLVEAAPLPTATPIPVQTVEVIRGGQVSEVSFPKLRQAQ